LYVLIPSMYIITKHKYKVARAVFYIMWAILALVVTLFAYALPSKSVVLMSAVQFGETVSTLYVWMMFCVRHGFFENKEVSDRVQPSYFSCACGFSLFECYTLRSEPEFILLYAFGDVIVRICAELAHPVFMIIKDMVQWWHSYLEEEVNMVQ
jgi:hypothetical protein